MSQPMCNGLIIVEKRILSNYASSIITSLQKQYDIVVLQRKVFF